MSGAPLVRPVVPCETPGDGWPCRRSPRESQCDRYGLGDFMGHTCGPREIADESLTFGQLRAANDRRVGQFRNRKGGLAHAKRDGSDWTPAQWLQAMVGELGEYANIRKKFERGDLDVVEFKLLAADELADTQIYLDLLAKQIGIDLGEATRRKFNRKSRDIGSDVTL